MENSRTICKTLKPYEKATIHMSVGCYPTLSMVIQSLKILYKDMANNTDALHDLHKRTN